MPSSPTCSQMASFFSMELSRFACACLCVDLISFIIIIIELDTQRTRLSGLHKLILHDVFLFPKILPLYVFLSLSAVVFPSICLSPLPHSSVCLHPLSLPLHSLTIISHGPLPSRLLTFSSTSSTFFYLSFTLLPLLPSPISIT